VGQKPRRPDSPDQGSSDQGPNSGAAGRTAAYAGAARPRVRRL